MWRSFDFKNSTSTKKIIVESLVKIKSLTEKEKKEKKLSRYTSSEHSTGFSLQKGHIIVVQALIP